MIVKAIILSALIAVPVLVALPAAGPSALLSDASESIRLGPVAAPPVQAAPLAMADGQPAPRARYLYP
jgi:hypothetical protein